MFYLVKVLIGRAALSLDRFFTYYSYDDSYHLGMRVLVPFGASKNTMGFILEEPERIDMSLEEYQELNDIKLAKINKAVDQFPLLDENLINLAHKIKDYYKSDMLRVLNVFFPPSLKPKDSALSKPQARFANFVIVNKDVNCTPNRTEARLLDEINKHKDGLRESKITAKKTLKKLLDSGVLTVKQVPLSRIPEMEIAQLKPFDLTDEQEKAFAQIVNSSSNVFLLEGVTGSGKTEVYLRLAEHYLKMNKGVIILVPEIALTDRMSYLFSSYFKESISILNSSLSDARKYDEYRKILFGESRIVLGTRSAIFAPVKNLGLIIIDEEHSNSYKQDNVPYYDAITVSKMRSEIEGAKVVLGSATPRIIDKVRAEKGIYEPVFLKKRYALNQDKEIIFIDMNNSRNLNPEWSPLFSIPLVTAINENLIKHQQTMLLLNRRGYSPVFKCRDCGHIVTCPNCNIPLNYHKRTDVLKCHHCGYQVSSVDYTCECGSKEFLKLGFGTERVFEDLRFLFPNAKIRRLDSDVSSNQVRHEVLADFASGEADIIIGTQIIAKGHDFPKVSLACILDADASLMLPTYMANEETFDLISQFVGRAGRAELKGKILIQTYVPDNKILKLAASQNYEEFYNLELLERKKYQYPPYTYLVHIVVRGIDLKRTEDVSYILKNFFLEKILDKRINLYGPSVPYIPHINGRFYRQLLLKYKSWDEMSPILDEIKTIRIANRDVEILTDVDPGSEAL